MQIEDAPAASSQAAPIRSMLFVIVHRGELIDTSKFYSGDSKCLICVLVCQNLSLHNNRPANNVLGRAEMETMKRNRERVSFYFVLVVVKRGGSKQIGQINTRHYMQAEASNQLQARVLTRLLAEPELEPVNDKREIIKFRDGGKQLCVAREDCVFVCFCSCSCEDTFPKRCSFQEVFFFWIEAI